MDYFSNLGYKIQIICEILGLNRSSYYKWKNRIVPEKENKDQELCELIIEYDCSYNHIWGTIKSEMYYIDKFYSIENLIQSIKDYIEFYNNKRFQAKLKCLAPMEYRNQALSA